MKIDGVMERGRIQAALQKSGVKVGRASVRRLMNQQKLKAIQPKSFKPRTTDSKGTLAALNLLAQINNEECGMRKLIVGDITYVPLKNGRWCYLAVWQDKLTRRIIGWSLDDSMTAELIISALQKAMRKGFIRAGAIIHSDRGSQYASTWFRSVLQQNGFQQSMSGKAYLKILSRCARKYSATSKAITTGLDCIQVWATKAH